MPSIRNVLLSAVLLCSAETANTQTVKGCTDRAANNFNANANQNDGSCTYNATTMTPVVKFTQAAVMAENSGMIFWNNRLWQHNDGGGSPAIYATDTTANTILRTVTVTGASNIDWEDIAQDDTHIYIGDFGNNANGARTDLKIYKVSKSSIVNTTGDLSVTAEVIAFRYSDQPQNPTPVAGNITDFDCEAMVVQGEKVYLFTKQWTGLQTTLYELPNSSGTHTATKLASLDVNGLVTGADILPSRRIIALTGYTKTLQRFVYLLYDFSGNGFFGANKRRIELLGLAQTESVSFLSQERLGMGSEQFSVFPSQLEALDISALLKEYFALVSAPTVIQIGMSRGDVRIYHSEGLLSVMLKPTPGSHAEIIMPDGRMMRRVPLPNSSNDIPIYDIPTGIYTMRVWQGRLPHVARFVVTK